MGKKIILFLLSCSLLLSAGCGKNEDVPPIENYMDPTATVLTVQQLDDCTAWFDQMENNGLLRVPYTNAAENPGQLVPYLEILLYDVGETDLTERELTLLADAGAYMDLDKFRLSRTLISEYLAEKFGISTGDSVEILQDPQPAPAGIYLAEYDAWYIIHSDTWYNTYTFTHGEKLTDGSVRLFYVNPFLTSAAENGDAEFFRDQLMAVTLIQRGGTWHVASNEILK